MDLSVVTGADDLPRVTALHPNVPNPFNPSTRIDFDLARDGRVDLSVFDLRGREVRALVDGALPRGRHLAVWDGRDVAGRRVSSGVYFYRLRTDAGDMMGKMVLVK